MKISKKGFTLIELLVVIAIIAILAAILFPVFARAREKARQTTCTSNQRQIAATVQMYAQDHEETLPASVDFWTRINVDPGVLICPTAGKSQVNGYVSNSALGDVAVGSLTDPTVELLTADGKTQTSSNTVNVAARFSDFVTRHSGKFIASYVDGHVSTASSLRMATAGAYLKSTDDSGNIITFVVDRTKPADAPQGAAALTIGSLSNFTGKLSLSGIGSHGYVVFTHAGAISSSLIKYPFNMPVATGFTNNAAGWCGFGFNDGVINETSAGGTQMSNTRSSSTVSIGVSDLKTHTLTVFSPARIVKSHKIIMSIANTGSQDAGAVFDYSSQYLGGAILQYTFTGDVTLTVKYIGCNVVGGDEVYQGATLKAIFLD
jgi:prepilin-type N-terminal cleavage/methylation domain-containing protein/prepilin-type processing-associated H-X9-DG protein